MDLSSRISWRPFLVLLPIAIVAYLAYGLFYEPALYSDDWTQIVARTVREYLPWLEMTSRRPMQLAPFYLQSVLLGLNVDGYYLLLGIVHIVLAAEVYLIVSQFELENRKIFSLAVALLFLVFPANFTHMWLTMLHIYSALALTLLYAYLMVLYAKSGRLLLLVIALFLFSVSMFIYEGQLGIACCWALVIFVLFRPEPRWKRFLLLLPLLIGLLFMLWRTIGYDLRGIEDDYLPQIVMSPAGLGSRLLLGIKILFYWAWSGPIQTLLPWNLGNATAFLLLAVTVLVIMLSIRYIRPDHREPVYRSVWLKLSDKEGNKAIRSYLVALLIGILLTAAGYVPIIVVFLPTLSNISSRFNLFAALGASVVWCSLLMIGALLLADRPSKVRTIFAAAMLPLLVVAIGTQAAVQYGHKIAWSEQQDIWHDLFVVAPDFQDDTTVLLLISGYEDRVGYQNWRRTPLYAYWEVSSALQLLYDNPSLAADLIYPDIPAEVEARLTPSGLVNRDTGVVTPYDRIAAFVYERDGELHRIDAISEDLIEGASAPVELNPDLVLDKMKDPIRLRQLVQQKSDLTVDKVYSTDPD